VVTADADSVGLKAAAPRAEVDGGGPGWIARAAATHRALLYDRQPARTRIERAVVHLHAVWAGHLTPIGPAERIEIPPAAAVRSATDQTPGPAGAVDRQRQHRTDPMRRELLQV